MARLKSPTGSKQTETMPATGAAVVQAAAASAVQTEALWQETRKADTLKTDSRPSLVPINLEDEIRRRAYELSERRGFEGGHETEDWLNAEREIRERYRKQSA